LDPIHVVYLPFMARSPCMRDLALFSGSAFPLMEFVYPIPVPSAYVSTVVRLAAHIVFVHQLYGLRTAIVLENYSGRLPTQLESSSVLILKDPQRIFFHIHPFLDLI